MKAVGTVTDAPIIHDWRGLGREAAEGSFLKRAQAVPRADMRAQTDDRHRRGVGLAFGVDRGRGSGFGVGQPFFNQGVCIDTAEAKPADRRAARTSRGARFPALRLGQDAKRPAVVIQLRAGRIEVRGWRQGLIFQRQQNLE